MNVNPVGILHPKLGAVLVPYYGPKGRGITKKELKKIYKRYKAHTKRE